MMLSDILASNNMGTAHDFAMECVAAFAFERASLVRTKCDGMCLAYDHVCRGAAPADCPDIGEVNWRNKEDTQREFNTIYNLRKRGVFTMSEDNNGKVKIGDKTYYYLVVQRTDKDKDTYDLLRAEGVTSKGRVYYFARRANRDNLYKYVMGQ